MSFGQPLWFWAFAIFPLVLALYFRNEAMRASLLRRLVATRLLDRLAGTVSMGKRRLRFALILLGLAAIIVSLAQPRLGHRWEQSKRKGRDVLIAIDVSKSMLANDLAPNRLVRARLAAQDLISQLGGDRVGLVAFAGSAFLQAPLTADFGAVLTSLNELDTEIIPRGGSNIAEALRVAVEAFGKGESDHRALIIFTDGEELDADGIKAAEKLKDTVKIFGVGVGSTEGSLIPLPGSGGGTEFVKDDRGQFVKSRLDEARLRKIAELTGGFYVQLRSGPAEMTQIVREGLAKMSEKDIDAKLSRQPIERYQWPLAAGLILLASSMLLGERRRAAAGVRRAAAAIAVAGAFGWTPAGAATTSPLDLYAGGKYEEAQKAWQKLAEKNPESGVLAFNWGAAAYKNKDLDTALKAFSQALASDDAGLRARAEYNLGNTLFQKGAEKMERKTLEDALAHYEQALALSPDDANARHNKKVTEELLEKLKEQEQQKQQEQKQDDQKDQKKEEDQQQKQDQQKSDSKEKQEQKDSDQKDGSKEEKEQQQKDGGKLDEKEQPRSQSDDSQGKKDGEQPKNEPQKDGNKDEQKQAQDGKPQDQKNGGEPAQPDRKLSGEVKANPSQPGEPQDAAEEAAAEELAAAEGRMTERQAKALLDSLKTEEERVRLLDPNERKRAGRVLRDW